VQYKHHGQWLLYAKYQDKGYTTTITREYKGSTGKVYTSQQTVWFETGRQFIHQLFD
jgi:anti-repressor protein